MKLKIIDLGKRDYGEVLEIQRTIQKQIIGHEKEDHLLLVEHNPVLTLGIRTEEKNILVNEQYLKEKGIDIYEVERGGDVTYHGPGQIVGYPIINLEYHKKSIRKYIIRLEEVFISLLKDEYNIDAHREEAKYTGIWVANKKITAMGVSVKKWVTMHGFAFNVNTDLSYFDLIVPCGLKERGVTSLENILGEKQDMDDVKKKLIKSFVKNMGEYEIV